MCSRSSRSIALNVTARMTLGGLVLTSRDLALKALKSGAQGIIPGKPEQSEMITRITSTDPEEQMPPPKHRAKHPVKARDIEVLRQWIGEGAKFTAHWAYQPILRPNPPAVQSAQSSVLSSQPIDLFVRAKLAETGISPSLEADAVTLIRRATYDLHGLPPTPVEVDAFVAEIKKLSTSSAITPAYERLLDRLLASDRFGERWGRHWLDMARYADSDGYEKIVRVLMPALSRLGHPRHQCRPAIRSIHHRATCG